LRKRVSFADDAKMRALYLLPPPPCWRRREGDPVWEASDMMSAFTPVLEEGGIPSAKNEGG
jgi:hypothetical protein